MKSEFAALNDLALGRGIKQSELVEQIQAAVLDAYFEQYPDHPAGVSVVVDVSSGSVRILVKSRTSSEEE